MPPFQGDIDISFSSQQEGGLFDKPVPLHHHESLLVLTTGRPQQRSVSFAPMAMVYDVENLDDYTDEEIKASWFDTRELQKMKKLARSQAKLLNSGQTAVKYDTRGLEHKTKEGIMKKRLHRMGAYSSVFFETEFQREEGIVDENAIADAYKPYSKPCSIAAQMAGERDAMEARKAYGKMMQRI